MTRSLVFAWLATFLLFGIWPGLDPWVSGLFFDTAKGLFPLAASGFLELLRNVIWNLSNVALLMALVFGIYALLATPSPAVPGRVWGFVLALILLGPLLLVNGVLKAHWGRARPADTDVFGGPLPFSPPWELAGNCPSNCSFVSGEAAAVTCLAIILALVLWNNVADKRRLLLALAALVVLGAGLRVLKGRHYLSDVVWSVLLMVTLAHVLALRLRVYEIAHRVTWAALRSDARRMRAALLRQERP